MTYTDEFTQKYFNKNYNIIQWWAQQMFETEILEDSQYHNLPPLTKKMVMEFYQKNPSALASLRGTVYEEKIIDLIKTKAKPSKKEISKEEAEKILKEHQKQDHNHEHDHNHDHDHSEEKKASKSAKIEKKLEPSVSKKPSAKKVSKK